MTCLGYRLVWRSGFAYHRWPPSPDQAVNKYILQLSIVGLVFYEGNGFSLLSRYDYKKRVRYGEVDRMGYLYYGNYAQYYEIGRVEWLRSLGVLYSEMEEVQGIMLPVVSMQMRFVRPARYDELLTLRTTLRKMPDEYVTFHMEIFNEKMKLVNGGTVRLCFVDMKTNKVVNVPDFLTEKLAPYFNVS